MCKHENHNAFSLDNFSVDTIKMSIRKIIREEDYRDYNIQFSTRFERISAEDMVFEIYAYVTGKVIDKIHVDVEYPSDWWEAFKDRWFPEWMLRKWPVKMTRIKINETRYAICPHLAAEPRHNHYMWLRDHEDICDSKTA